MSFTDEVTIVARGGDGGAGSASLRREPFNPRGGPDGGDGGAGGAVVLRVDPALFDLSSYLDRRVHRAEKGGPGSRNNRHGADGEDLVLHVPDGTVVSDENGLLADLVGAGSSIVVARGGRGGRGTASLASPRNRVPRVAEQGETGEERRVTLELKLVADVGLVGAPNAGKSTLLAALTAARPKIADYPFTTLSPNLGVAEADERFVVADIPGLIEGAHEGRGLGLEFLRHVSRCRVLVYVVDLTQDPSRDLLAIRSEVASFDNELARRQSLVVGTKADLLDGTAEAPDVVDIVVSAVTGQGMSEFKERIDRLVETAKGNEPPRTPYVVLRPGREPFVVKREGERYRVAGQRVERWVAELDFDDETKVAELQRKLVKAGVERRLAEAGARRGDEVVIGTATFEFIPEHDESV
ncbi:MAG TPA: GTPase ObgE [Actinomycetota bacterium]